MKHGEVQNSESEFPYWIMPDKPMTEKRKIDNCETSTWDQHKTHDQTENIKQYLTNALEPGSWIELNHRFFFKKQEDYESMLLMFKLGWN